jgi:hypothetical protein
MFGEGKKTTNQQGGERKHGDSVIFNDYNMAQNIN